MSYISTIGAALVTSIVALSSPSTLYNDTVDGYNVSPEYSNSSAEMGAHRREYRMACNCLCGVHNGPSAPIREGEEANWHEIPWLATLYLLKEFHCGGVLITDKHVLTAAHCLYGFRKSTIKVELGVHLQNDNDGMIQRREIERAVYHKDYDEYTFFNDIGMIFLNEKVDITYAVKPACLPLTGKGYVGWNATVAGWGIKHPNSDESSNVLMKVDVLTLRNSVCKTNQDFYPGIVTENNICTAYVTSNKGPCMGDSGGPLQVFLENGVTEVIGLVSFGKNRCAKAGSPVVYTRVTKYLRWIDKVMGNYCRCTRRPKT